MIHIVSLRTAPNLNSQQYNSSFVAHIFIPQPKLRNAYPFRDVDGLMVACSDLPPCIYVLGYYVKISATYDSTYHRLYIAGYRL